MKLAHFHAFKPLCPLCKATQRIDFPLSISFAEHQTQNEILSGALLCSNPACQCEYPIIDSIPYLFPDIRKYLSEHHLEILLRDDLPSTLLNILHESAGAGSWLNSHRQHLSSYMYDHYDPSAASVLTGGNGLTSNGRLPIADEGVGATECSSPYMQVGICGLIQKVISLANNPSPDKTLEIGCCVGRGTYELAQLTHSLTLGIDISPLFLRKAVQIQKTHRASYDLRRSGLLYEHRDLPFDHPASDQVDFWAADALALPFPDHHIPALFAMNVLDCVPSPVAMLNEILRATSHIAALATPWDWTSAVTPEENWIGGHSPRSNCRGDSLFLLKTLLPPTVKILAEQKNIPWQVRLHDKHTAQYQTDLIVLETHP
jgi:uncharacterized protein YbaR (Trm112 family)/SAM-dependent methyltransferase